MGDAMSAPAGVETEWRVTAEVLDQPIVVCETTNEETAARRYRTHTKMQTNPQLWRRTIAVEEWEQVK
jgi:hypothetical protein